VGTASDNLFDRSAKNLESWKRGSQHGESKLTEDDVRAMRAAYAAGGVRQVDLARQYGIDQRTVSVIIRRTGWRHVE
jgi:DNA-binding MarR family transcriptional regulator